MDAPANGVTPIPSQIEVHETVLATMRSKGGKKLSAGDYLSPVIETKTKAGSCFRFNDQEDKDINDEVGPYDRSPMVEVGIEKGTYSCKPHRRSIVLGSENNVQDDTGLMNIAVLSEKPVTQLHNRRTRLILASANLVTNYPVACRYDVGALWSKWGTAGSDPQDNIQQVIEEMALRINLSEEEIMSGLYIYSGKGMFRATQTKVVGTIHANVGDSKLVKTESVRDYFGVTEFRTAFASQNTAGRAVAAGVRSWITPNDQLILFYKPQNPTSETPQWKATLRFMGTDKTGRPTSGGWTVSEGEPPVDSLVARDWYDNATFDWNAAAILHNGV